MNKKIKNTTPKYVTILYILTRQLSLFLTAVFASLAIESLLETVTVGSIQTVSFQGTDYYYAAFITFLVISAILWFVTPEYIKTPKQIVNNGGRLISVIFGSLSSLIFAILLFTGIMSLINSDGVSTSKFTIVEVGLLQLIVTGLAVRYFWQGTLPNKSRKYYLLGKISRLANQFATSWRHSIHVSKSSNLSSTSKCNTLRQSEYHEFRNQW
jgi:hypothetical protein